MAAGDGPGAQAVLGCVSSGAYEGIGQAAVESGVFRDAAGLAQFDEAGHVHPRVRSCPRRG